MQISNEIIKVLEHLCNKIGVVIDWTNANIFPYIEQLCEKLITYESATSVVWIVISSFILVFSVACIFFINVIYDGWEGVEYLIFGAIIAFSIFAITIQIFDIIACNTFPEKIIYDYVQTYLNK